MKRFLIGFPLMALLAAGGGAQANQVMIDFTGATPVSQGLRVVNDKASDNVTTIVQKGGENTAATGGTDARYLSLAIDPAFKQNLKSAWVTVTYFDAGKDGFKLQYDGQDDPATIAADPNPRQKFDSQQFQTQIWHLDGPKLQGGMDGGADLRIDDRGADDVDGPEYIARVTVSDEDPLFTHFPYAATPITIDGKKDDAEWAGAAQVVLDRPQQDAVVGSPYWKNPEQFSAVYSLKWDEKALYILGEIKDATPRYNDVPGGLKYWSGDGIELEVGLDDSDPERTAMLDGSDYKLEVGVGLKPGWALRINGGADKITLDPIGSNIAITDVPGGYVYELQVPWAKFDNASVKAGQRIAWNIVANNSTIGNPSDQQMSLSPAGVTDPWGNPSRWIRAVLDPKP